MHKPVVITHSIPRSGEPGAFGAVRKHDIHTGIDLYCQDNAEVRVIEEGRIVAIEAFTGSHADSPWWNDTWAVLVEGSSGVICYGEIRVYKSYEVGMQMYPGDCIGHVIPVLKQDKGVTPTTMLHFEVYRPGTMKTVWWHHGEPQPESLLDPTELVRKLYE